jgi:hypothetical protein
MEESAGQSERSARSREIWRREAAGGVGGTVGAVGEIEGDLEESERSARSRGIWRSRRRE